MSRMACRAHDPRPRARRISTVLLIVVALIGGIASPRVARAQTAARDSLSLGALIASRLAEPHPPELRGDEWTMVARLYRRTDSTSVPVPNWIDGDRLASRARDFTSALGRIESHGLRPRDYPLSALSDALVAATPRSGAPADVGALARADVLLTASFVDLIDDMLTGRVDPRDVEPGWHIAPRPLDFEARVVAALDALRGNQPASEVLAGLRPDYGVYSGLTRALATYRAFALRGGWTILAGGPTLVPGDTGQRVVALRQRLAAEEFLPSAAGSDSFDTALAAAVAEFQRRHGLEVDSLVGPRTRSALDVSAEHRVRQIEANLERLRWLPPDPGERFIVVNVPSFRLLAFDGGRQVLGMAVVVGDELTSRRTPIFADTMQYIEFGPYWNVPRSIAVNEILPKARRDRAYLARNRFQILRGWGDDAPVVDPRSLSDAALFSTRYRVRQLPGPNNALGRVKFMFPNDYAVYLHDTPARALFDETDRAHSHGCVRVQDPAALAGFVLQDRADWPRERIDSTLAAGRRRRVDLARGVPVYLIYLTAFTRDGELSFRDDIYQRDARLLEAIGGSDAGPR